MRIGLMLARHETACLIDQYHGLSERLVLLESELLSLVKEVLGAKEMIDITDIGVMTVVIFFSKISDITQCRDTHPIIKLAGLNLMMN